MPNTVAEAKALDEKNGTTLWQYAIQKEMRSVKVAFDILGDNAQVPSGYKCINCHMIFDVKMENFCRKARFVAGGHM